MIKAVFFDVDNTLLDFDAYVKTAMKDGFEKFHLGTYTPEHYQTFLAVNGELWRRIEKGTLTFEGLLKDRWNEVFKALGISFDGQEFERYFRAALYTSAIPMQGAKEILDYLKGRYALCAASNGPHEQQLNRLKTGGMLEYFDECFISEKVGASKPSKEYFTRCFSWLNESRKKQGKPEILPSETLIVGDSLTSDIDGGIKNGLLTCWLKGEGKGEPGDRKIDYIIHSLAELKQIL